MKKQKGKRKMKLKLIFLMLMLMMLWSACNDHEPMYDTNEQICRGLDNCDMYDGTLNSCFENMDLIYSSYTASTLSDLDLEFERCLEYSTCTNFANCVSDALEILE